MNKILSNLTKRDVPTSAKRVGRGYGSTKGGHTASRGQKGQKSRTGGQVKLWYEGGQTPLIKRMPYSRGFINLNKKDILGVNISQLNAMKDVVEFTPAVLIERGLIPKHKYGVEIKVLATGKLDRKINLKGFLYSKHAHEKIVAAGGSAN